MILFLFGLCSFYKSVQGGGLETSGYGMYRVHDAFGHHVAIRLIQALWEARTPLALDTLEGAKATDVNGKNE